MPYINLKIRKKCLYCGEIKAIWRNSKYCSYQCYWKSKIGKPAYNKSKLKVYCQWCKKEFDTCPSKIKFGGGKYCSIRCRILGLTGKPNKRKKVTVIKECPVCKQEFRCYSQQKFCSNACKYKWRKENWVGKNSPAWKGDKCKKRDERNDSLYHWWSSKIKKRDNNKCRINNQDCSGYCEVHHILPWRDYPELRYEINNGITLCQAHHPRKRAEEKRLIPFFQGLVSVSN